MFLFSIGDKKNNILERELNDICERYYLDIYKYCAARLDISYSEDITNEVFELFCRKRQTLENKNYKSWLYETADNFLKNFYKKQKRKTEKEIYINESIAQTLSYEQNFEIISCDDIERYKDEILEILTAQELQLFDMNYIQKLPHTQICEELAISDATLNKRLYRLKQKIRSQISEKIKTI